MPRSMGRSVCFVSIPGTCIYIYIYVSMYLFLSLYIYMYVYIYIKRYIIGKMNPDVRDLSTLKGVPIPQPQGFYVVDG